MWYAVAMGETIHVVPLGDLIEHITDGTDCLCGPSIEYLGEGGDGDAWLISHHSLDGRELEEDDEIDSCGG